MEVKFYKSSSGRNPTLEFLEDQSAEIRNQFFDTLELLTMGIVLQMPRSKNLSNIKAGLHELRLKDRFGQVRVIYYIKSGTAIFIIHGFKKKTQQTPRRGIEIVLSRIRGI